MAVDVWALAGACFDTDDGSLPGIEIDRLSPAGLAAIYQMLRERSHLVGDPTFWCLFTEADIPVDSVPDAASRVATGRAEPFHILISGLTMSGITLPDLGVFVFQETIELDYRMGRDWRPPEVAGFFDLLHECCALDPNAVVTPASGEGPPYPDRFSAAWSAY